MSTYLDIAMRSPSNTTFSLHLLGPPPHKFKLLRDLEINREKHLFPIEHDASEVDQPLSQALLGAKQLRRFAHKRRPSGQIDSGQFAIRKRPYENRLRKSLTPHRPTN